MPGLHAIAKFKKCSASENSKSALCTKPKLLSVCAAFGTMWFAWLKKSIAFLYSCFWYERIPKRFNTSTFFGLRRYASRRHLSASSIFPCRSSSKPLWKMSWDCSGDSGWDGLIAKLYFLRLSRISRSKTTSSGTGGGGGASMRRILLTTLTIWKITKANKMKLMEIVMKLP